MFVFCFCYGIMNKITLIGEKMKLRRSERMVVISNYLINHPYELTSLNTLQKNTNLPNLLFQKILSLLSVPLKRLKLEPSKRLLVLVEE